MNKKRYIYHITDAANVTSIFTSGGLWATNKLKQNNVAHHDIAYARIQERRARVPVPCGPRGNLHDYVPWYFAPRSPMLYVIHRGQVPQYQNGQRRIVHLVSSIDLVQKAEVPFVFCDGHAAVQLTNFYTDVEDLVQVDWQVMKSRQWDDTREDNDRLRRRQAEFLVHDFCPCRLLCGIGVMNEDVQAEVEGYLRHAGHELRVAVRPNWYY